MKFGAIPVAAAEGAVLAHSLRVASRVLKKGRSLSRADLDALTAAGFTHVTAARIGPDDVGEDAAALRIARRVGGSGVRIAEPFTGRANLYAVHAGVLRADAPRLGALNAVDEAITIATLDPFERVVAGQMVATVKIITFAVEGRLLERIEAVAAGPLLSVAPFAPHRAGLVLTRLPATHDHVLRKREQVMAERLSGLGSVLAETRIVGHAVDEVRAAITALAGAGCDPVLVFAASAIVDRGDVIPVALTAAGGEVVHLGMPVDPGNLLMLGRLGDVDVLGVPSCAGSPKLNGFDWVLERRLAGLPVGRAEIAAMGVGGLLKEIASRPQPREHEAVQATPRREPRIGAVVLAAGRSTRMGARNKMLVPVGGRAMVVRAVEAALASRARPVHVVTGHEAEAVAEALAGYPVRLVHNPIYAEGLAGSLRAGLASLPPDLDGFVILLGDMPRIEGAHVDRLIAAFAPKEGRAIVVPVAGGKRGNPQLWAATFLRELMALEGDSGARQLIGRHGDEVVEVDLGTDAVLLDVDTPEALDAVDRA